MDFIGLWHEKCIELSMVVGGGDVRPNDLAKKIENLNTLMN